MSTSLSCIKRVYQIGSMILYGTVSTTIFLHFFSSLLTIIYILQLLVMPLIHSSQSKPSSCNFNRNVKTNYKRARHVKRLQTTQPTSGGAVTADSSCCANCVEPSRPQQWGPNYRFLACWPCGLAGWLVLLAHKSG